MHLKKLMLLATSAIVVGLLAVPAGASAATVAKCEFTGLAGNISPGVMLVGGAGRYDFHTGDPATSRCSSTDDPGGAASPSRIDSFGSFTNIVCGTGQATSQAENPADSTTIDYKADGPGPGDISSAEYTIDFEATEGQLDIETVNGSPELRGPVQPDAPGGPLNGQPGPNSGDVDGHVTILPTTGSCTAATGVTAFTVAGAFHAIWGV
jgi:hypothetical protein